MYNIWTQNCGISSQNHFSIAINLGVWIFIPKKLVKYESVNFSNIKPNQRNSVHRRSLAVWSDTEYTLLFSIDVKK